MEELSRQKQNEIYTRDRIISEKDTDLIIAKNDIERAKSQAADRQNTLEAYRQQLDDSYLKCKSLQESNAKLQLTLKDTQDELDRFVKQYETLNQALGDSEHHLQLARKLNYELKRDLDDKTSQLQEIKSKDELRDREL